MTDPFQRLAAALAGRYRLARELGAGGMATVYLAEDLKHHRQVALKVLRPELAAALGAERFLREIEIAAGLHHPHILPLYDSGEADGFLYYVMPYVEGESLRDRLTREKQLPLDNALQIAREVADALSYAHSHAVVHRDIKPENILLESGHAVVADFGIARAISAAGGETLTGTGVAIGTPAYMSPEQAAGDHNLDGRSDLYSLGCVLYEMLGGQPPFTGPTIESVVHQHLAVEPRAITQLRPAVPAEVAAALARALAKMPADRFNPVGQFAEALAHPGIRPASSPVTAPAAPARRPSPRGLAIAALGGLVVFSAALLFVRGRATHRGVASPVPRIVVLPFGNLGNPADEYFADGVTEEITSRLGETPGLGVIARTSAVLYKGTNKNVKQIGDELNVGYVLEGTVRWERAPGSRGRVRVTPQLIRVADQTHLWSERYDAVLTDIFQVQSHIAEKVADALGVTLLAADSARRVPTKNLDAYDFYLRGQEYYHRSWSEDDLRNTLRLFERAVALDPEFALAHARRSVAHSAIYWFRFDHTVRRLTQAKEAADRALRLSPGLPEGHEALAFYHYWGHLDFDRALEEFRLAQRAQPNNADLIAAIGYVERRGGNFEQARAAIQRAFELNPRSAIVASEVGVTLTLLGRFAEAERYLDRTIALAPDWPTPYFWKARVHLHWTGSTAKARATLEEGLARSTSDRWWVELPLAWVAALEGRYAEALERLRATPETLFNTHENFVPKAEYYARIYGLTNRPDLARAYHDSARALLAPKVQDDPDNATLRSALGIALAGLRRKDEAVREGSKAVELMPVSRDALDGQFRVLDLARIYVMVGEQELALDQLESIMSPHSGLAVTPTSLRIDPTWAPLHGNPRFEHLLGGGPER